MENITLEVEGDSDRFACEFLYENSEGPWTEGPRKARASGTSVTQVVTA